MSKRQTVWLIAMVGMLAGAAYSAEPKITISAENQQLEDVLQHIEKSSGVDVELSDKKWAQDLVSFTVKNSDLEKALDSVLSPYDYVLEWYANGNDFSKVVVTVNERKFSAESMVCSSPLPILDVPPALNIKQLDDSEVSAFPPGKNGLVNISVEQLRIALAQAEREGNQERLSAFPPGGPGMGISAAGLKNKIKK